MKIGLQPQEHNSALTVRVFNTNDATVWLDVTSACRVALSTESSSVMTANTIQILKLSFSTSSQAQNIAQTCTNRIRIHRTNVMLTVKQITLLARRWHNVSNALTSEVDEQKIRPMGDFSALMLLIL